MKELKRIEHILTIGCYFILLSLLNYTNASGELPKEFQDFLYKTKPVSEGIRSIDITENNRDHLSSCQWYLKQIKADKAWEYFSNISDSNNLPKIEIAVVEEGKAYKHPEYKEAITKTPCYSDWEEDKPQCGKNFDSKIFYSYNDLVDFYSEHPSYLEELDSAIKNKSENNLYSFMYFDFGIEESIKLKNYYYARGNLSEKADSFQTEDHHTAVAGLISSKHNEYGIKGICPYTKIIPFSIFPQQSNDPFEIINPVTYLLEEIRPDAVNLSRGLNFVEKVHVIETNWLSSYRKMLGKNGEKLKIPVVVAAGNIKPGITPSIDNQPITDDPFIPVGSCTKFGQHSKGTRYGDNLRLYAPGGVMKQAWDREKFKENELNMKLSNALISTSFLKSDFLIVEDDKYSGGYNLGYSGTSLSAPLVTGTIGLMLTANPLIYFKDIKRILYSSNKFVNVENLSIKERPKNKPVLLNAKTAVKGAFQTVAEYWKNYWSEFPTISERGYRKYYSKNSIIVRGVVKGNNLIYNVYSDKENLNINKYVKEPIISWLKSNNLVDLKVQFSKQKALKDFFAKSIRIGNKHRRIRIKMDFSDYTFEPSNCNPYKMDIKFNQDFSALNKSGTKVLYSDFGMKHLVFVREEGQWVINNEIWYYKKRG